MREIVYIGILRAETIQLQIGREVVLKYFVRIPAIHKIGNVHEENS